MKIPRSFFVRLRNIFQKSSLDRDLSAELSAHLDLHIEENLRAGMTLEEARRAALLKLGGIEQTKESVRDDRGIPFLESLLQDLCFGLRILGKNPSFASTAILTLTLGIGVNVSVFTLINSLILRPLPYPEADRVVQVDRQTKDGPYYGMSLSQFRMYQQQNRTFQYLAAYDMVGSGLSLNAGIDPELVHSRRVSPDFFRAVGIPPVMGRDFNTDDGRAGAAPVVILSYRIWKDLLGGNPSAIANSVRMGGENYTLIGITPPNFAFSRDADAWIPLPLADAPSDHASAFNVIGRLRATVPYQFAKQDLDAINARIRQEYPGLIDSGEVGTIIVPFQERVVGDVRPMLLLLAAAVACVLLIACSNIANLLLARAVNRRKEIAIRAALGISRARLVRQLLTESLLLSLSGGLAGLLLSHWCVRLFLALSHTNIPRVSRIGFDVHVLLFTLSLALISGIVFGLAPVFQLGRLDSSEVLRESGRATGSITTRRVQGFLVSSQICLATILLLGAGLLLSSFAELLHVNPGFDPHPVLTLKSSLAGPSFVSPTRLDAVVQRSVQHLQTLPGIQAVAVATMLPTGPSVQLPFELPSLPAAERPALDAEVQWRAISPAYFTVMSVPVLQGRSFSESDSPGSSPVVIVNQAFFREYFPHLNGMGQSVLIGRREGPQFADRSRQIVGVVADSHELGLSEPVAPAVFIPFAQVPDGLLVFMNRIMPMNWLFRVSGAPLAYAPAIHRELLAVDPDLVASNPTPLDQLLSDSLAQQRMETALVGFFSTAALLLGAIGLYGVLSYSVAERRREIAIRIAVGADRAQILWLVVVHGLKLTLIGILVGVAGGLALTRFMSSLLFGVGANDPLTFASVTALLMLVALAACYLPARRAIRVDPMIALRYE